jgi:hypothetical protein
MAWGGAGQRRAARARPKRGFLREQVAWRAWVLTMQAPRLLGCFRLRRGPGVHGHMGMEGAGGGHESTWRVSHKSSACERRKAGSGWEGPTGSPQRAGGVARGRARGPPAAGKRRARGAAATRRGQGQQARRPRAPHTQGGKGRCMQRVRRSAVFQRAGRRSRQARPAAAPPGSTRGSGAAGECMARTPCTPERRGASHRGVTCLCGMPDSSCDATVPGRAQAPHALSVPPRPGASTQPYSAARLRDDAGAAALGLLPLLRLLGSCCGAKRWRQEGHGERTPRRGCVLCAWRARRNSSKQAVAAALARTCFARGCWPDEHVHRHDRPGLGLPHFFPIVCRGGRVGVEGVEGIEPRLRTDPAHATRRVRCAAGGRHRATQPRNARWGSSLSIAAEPRGLPRAITTLPPSRLTAAHAPSALGRGRCARQQRRVRRRCARIAAHL